MSYWRAPARTTTTATGAPPSSVDVVVVGAGIAGLLISNELADRGHSVSVIESRIPGAGTTGASTAKVTVLHGSTYSQVRRHHGDRGASDYAAANLAGFRLLEAVVPELGDIGWARNAALTYTGDPGSVDQIDAELAAAAAAGLAVSSVGQLSNPVQIERAVRLADQAVVDPVRLVDALAKRLERRDQATLSFGCVVHGIDVGDPHVVHTSQGPVRARWVVVATLAPVVDPTLVFARASPTLSHSMAVELAEPAPRDSYLSIDSPSRSIRPVAGPGNERLAIVGGSSHRVGSSDGRSEQDELERWAREQLGAVEVLAAWSAHDLVPHDSLPFIGEAARRGAGGGLYVASGFRKWGFTNAAAAALLIAGHVDGDPPPWSASFDPGRRPTRASSIGSTVTGNLTVAGHFVGDRLATLRPGPLTELADGEGRIVEVDGVKLAAHRRPDGEVVACSASCTHLGCLVAWNAADRTWDCPCHGSRFDVDGSVLAGPAITPLRTYRLDGSSPS